MGIVNRVFLDIEAVIMGEKTVIIADVEYSVDEDKPVGFVGVEISSVKNSEHPYNELTGYDEQSVKQDCIEHYCMDSDIC